MHVSSADAASNDGAEVDPSPAWLPISADPVLVGAPVSLGPGNVPAGGDLRLDIGWDAFEQLLASIARYALGLNQIRFRRYGVPGQSQHGIDLAGKRPDGSYTVVQCKEVKTFTASGLRRAVEKFASGRRPFNAKHFIVAVSHPDARTTQVQDELAILRNEYRDELELDLWGPDGLNDVLRERGDIVARFWTRETASTFCTGAPLPGVGAPPADWTRVADQILLSPLGVDGLDRDVAEAERLEGADPTAAASAYGQIGDRLAAEGFGGHAHVMWRRQLDVLAAADDVDTLCALAARLAAVALHEGDPQQARGMSHTLNTFANRSPQGGGKASPTVMRHAALIRAAVDTAEHPLGANDALLDVLRDAPASMPAPEYQPMLVLLLTELNAADAVIARGTAEHPHGAPEGEPNRDAELNGLVASSLDQLLRAGAANEDLAIRLRMARARHDSTERMQLLAEARQLRLPRTQAALVLAAEARRSALTASPDDALENWRQAIANAIHEGRTDDAAGWLYAIRAVHIRYGPWTNNIDEEHLLAQALPRSTAGRIIRRVRDPEKDARREALANQPVASIRSARRWLADSIVTGDWVDEDAAAEMLGDLYAANAELDRAAVYYQWAGKTKKLLGLAEAIGDHLLPEGELTSPWWRQESTLALVAAQHDLVPDDLAAQLLTHLLDLVARARAGELTEGPTRSLTTQATKTACVLAARGTSSDALELLDLLADGVAREENQHQFHDKQHVEACLAIAEHHAALAFPAFSRLFDLADVGTHDALSVLRDDRVLDALRDEPMRRKPSPLASHEQAQLKDRLHAMALAGRYDAAIALATLGIVDDLVTQRATEARDRLLAWPEPDGHSASFGTTMVPDSYLVTFLRLEDRQNCATRLLTVAEDQRETASNRNDALTAVCNLVADDEDDAREAVHMRSRPFVTGERDGSWLDDQTTQPHPLSTMKIDFGSPSLRARGLRLAHFTAVTDEQKTWVRGHGVAMLRGPDGSEVRTAAVVLAGLAPDILGTVDPALLAGHPLTIVRQLAVIVATTDTTAYQTTLQTLAADPDHTVRLLLAQRLRNAQAGERNGPGAPTEQTTIDALLAILAADVRHSVRRASSGFDDR